MGTHTIYLALITVGAMIALIVAVICAEDVRPRERREPFRQIIDDRFNLVTPQFARIYRSCRNCHAAGGKSARIRSPPRSRTILTDYKGGRPQRHWVTMGLGKIVK